MAAGQRPRCRRSTPWPQPTLRTGTWGSQADTRDGRGEAARAEGPALSAAAGLPSIGGVSGACSGLVGACGARGRAPPVPLASPPRPPAPADGPDEPSQEWQLHSGSALLQQGQRSFSTPNHRDPPANAQRRDVCSRSLHPGGLLTAHPYLAPAPKLKVLYHEH